VTKAWGGVGKPVCQRGEVSRAHAEDPAPPVQGRGSPGGSRAAAQGENLYLLLTYSATAAISSSVIFSTTECITALSLVRSRLLNDFSWVWM